MGLGVILMELLTPFFELFLPIIPGDVFPYFFGETVRGYPVLSLQRALIAAIAMAIVAGYLREFPLTAKFSINR